VPRLTRMPERLRVASALSWLIVVLAALAATIGLALLSMTVFALRAGLKVEPALSMVWGALAVAGLAMSFWFFRHCSNG
jgi:hypothetical protein